MPCHACAMPSRPAQGCSGGVWEGKGMGREGPSRRGRGAGLGFCDRALNGRVTPPSPPRAEVLPKTLTPHATRPRELSKHVVALDQMNERNGWIAVEGQWQRRALQCAPGSTLARSPVAHLSSTPPCCALTALDCRQATQAHHRREEQWRRVCGARGQNALAASQKDV